MTAWFDSPVVAGRSLHLAGHRRPKRPHRSELVALCDVSGSVAQFPQFTLLLVFALQEQLSKVRAFTLVDDIREVTQHFRPGDDPARTIAELAESVAHGSLWGRTDYGRAFTRFQGRQAEVISMTECRNLSQLSDFVHDIM